MTKKEASVFTERLAAKGYKCHKGHYKSEDFGYWKCFEVSGEGDEKKAGYQLAVLFYDRDKYKDWDPSCAENVGISFDALFNHNGTGRYDFSVTDDRCTIERFEKDMAEIYELLKSKIETKCPKS